MSKSYGNALTLGMGDEEIDRMVMSMITDPQRAARHPRPPGGLQRLHLHALLDAPQEEVYAVYRGCTTAVLGCVEDKRDLAARVRARIAPIRERRAALLAEPERIDAILELGAERARPSRRPSSPRSRRRWGCEAVVTVGDLAASRPIRAGSRAGAYDRQVVQDAEPSSESRQGRAGGGRVVSGQVGVGDGGRAGPHGGGAAGAG